MFQLFATGVVDTNGKFNAGVVDIRGNLPVSLTPKFATGFNDSKTPTGGKIYHQWQNLPPVAKFTTGVVDTIGKLASAVIDSGGAP